MSRHRSHYVYGILFSFLFSFSRSSSSSHTALFFFLFLSFFLTLDVMLVEMIKVVLCIFRGPYGPIWGGGAPRATGPTQAYGLGRELVGCVGGDDAIILPRCIASCFCFASKILGLFFSPSDGLKLLATPRWRIKWAHQKQNDNHRESRNYQSEKKFTSRLCSLAWPPRATSQASQGPSQPASQPARPP